MRKLAFLPTKATIITIILFIFSCGESVKKVPEINPEFGQYISAFTSGIVSKQSKIVIQLATDYYKPVKKGSEVEVSLFDFDPSINGKAYWQDAHTIEFVPEEMLQSGKVYDGEFRLSKLLNVPDEFSTFPFQFKTIQQDFKVLFDGLSPYDEDKPEEQMLKGKLLTADFADSSAVKKLLNASQSGRTLDISWQHNSDRTHLFTIENIASKGSVFVKWDGDALDIDTKNEESIEVPALGDFKVTNYRVVQTPEQYIELFFSDPILKKQNLDGIITIGSNDKLTFSVDGNKVTVFPNARFSGTQTVFINEGLKNNRGYKISLAQQMSVRFEQIKPDVKLVGNGNIIPNSDGLIFPFEAVNLSAVDVHITKIYESNILQFLQDNNQLDGTRNLYRVANKVAEKTVHLNEISDEDLQSWNRYYLDLSSYVSVDPGAIYNVELRYKKEYSLYNCGEADDGETDNLTQISFEKEDDWHELYDRYRNYYWSYDDYDYRERDNPCHNSYYYPKSVSRNVLASDLGMIAKIGEDRKVHVAVNNLVNTNPMQNVEVEFYNYQQQEIGKAMTDENGTVSQQLPQKPFVVIAKNGKQRGYLKLDDGNSLFLSKFDVSGATTQKGVKGFIYGERGVWRPGDSIYVSFILEDKEKVLPPSHPVKFELVNPRGQTVQTTIKAQSVNGFFDFRTATNQDDPTGNYTAWVSVGNRTFYKKIKVETVKPNRLKIYLNFDKEILTTAEKPKANLQVKWLHGAVAKNLKTQVDVALNATNTTFDKFKGYEFDDPLRDFSASESTIFESQLDADGEAVFTPDLAVSDAAPGMLKAYFTTRVFEESGNFSIDRHSVKYSPYKSYVGVKLPESDLYRGSLEVGKEHEIEIATVDENGNPISRNGLQVKVYEIQWRWWWDSYDDNIASYISNKSVLPVQDLTVNTSNGRASFTLDKDKYRYHRYLVHITDPVSGHSTGEIFYMTSRYWNTKGMGGDAATMLVFSADKEKYNVGETAKVTFPSSPKGRALVCLETGTKVLKKFWVETEKGETEFEVPVTAEMAPNVYLQVSLLQPHFETENDLPIRMYGVIPMMVENPETHLKPVVNLPEVLKPEGVAQVKVSEASGKRMTYTLAMVDEGLLDLTRFKTPDPWNHFYAREALGVKTWDLYDMVLGAYGGELDRILSIGGDGSNGPTKPAKANRFKPMVKFIGPFELKKGETASHNIIIPNYVGSVRVMVVAGQDGAYGNTEKTVPVRKPLMVLGTLPRVLGPTETVLLPVNVFAMEDHVKNVDVEVKTNDLFSIKGSKTKNVRFSKPGDEVVYFELEVAKKVGIGKVEISTKSGKETAYHEIELDVRASNPRVVDVIETVIEPGKTWNSDFAFSGVEGTNKGALEVSSIPPIDLKRRLNYLIRYPHGCIEQTTSSVFPQVFVHNLMDLESEQLQKIETNIKAGIQRLQLFQTAQGGFAYWPGRAEPNDWGTNYGGHFILEAEMLGYKLPEDMKKNWVKYQRKMAREYRTKHGTSDFHGHAHHNDLTQAYRLYVLALAGHPEMGAMNRLRETSELSLPSKWRLAAAYLLIGQNEVARQMVKGISTEVKDYKELSYTYGSNLRDEAMILETLSMMREKTEGAIVAKRVSERLSNPDRWMSTQETAYCLLGMSKYLGKNAKDKKMNFAFSINGKSEGSVTSEVPIFQQELEDVQITDNGKVSIENIGESTLYAKLVLEGIPATGEENEVDKNLKLDVDYYNLKGEPISPASLEQGTDFIAEVKLHNTGMRGNFKEMALTQIFPSGWEIRNTRMDEFSAIQNDDFDYQDIRDDRIYTYYALRSNEKKTFRVMLNATYAGRFYLPTVASEAMYDNTIYARQPGKWVEVKEAGKLVEASP